MRSGRVRTRTIPILVGLASLLTACVPQVSPSPTASTSPTSTASAPASTGTAGPKPSATPKPSSKPTATPSAAAGGTCAERTLASMTEEQRVGQLFVIGLVDDKLSAAERRAIAGSHFGSMTFTTHSSAGVTAIRKLTDAVQALATDASTAGVRFFIAANQEGGQIQGLSGAGFGTIPSAVTQGTWTTAKLQAQAEAWGRDLADAGVNLDFAPVSDVVPAGTEQQNAPIGQLKREFGSDPTAVASHVAAFVAGMRAAGIDTTLKHFPGLGRVVGNTDFTGQVDDTVTTRGDAFLAPFQAGIQAGAPFVMVSLATYQQIDPDHLAVFSPAIMQAILHDDLGFRGVVISDAFGAKAVASVPPGTRAIDFIAAGGDMIISNQTAPAVEMAAAVVLLARGQTSFRARVDDAAMRVLEAKDAAGLLPCD
jgi:beta-N-acetylhexosaminidase